MILLVTCERCHKKLRSYAALKDHWKSRHSNTPLPNDLDKHLIEEKEVESYKRNFSLGKGSRRWLTVTVTLIVIILIGVVAYQTASQNSARPVFTTNATVTNTVWNDRQFSLNGTLSWVQATLNPLSKTNYEAYGHIQIVSGCFTMNVTATGQYICPSILMTVYNQTGFVAWQTETLPIAHIYGEAQLMSTATSSDFILKNPDYDGTYYFTFETHQLLPNLPKPIVSITLTETWTGMQSTTGITNPTGFLITSQLSFKFRFSLSWHFELASAICSPLQL